jgi:hypothetical protein
MFKYAFVNLVTAAGLVFANPAFAQVTTIDPNNSGEYEPAVENADPASTSANSDEYQPVDAGTDQPEQSAQPGFDTVAPAQPQTGASAAERASEAVTVPPEDVFTAAEGVFGKGAEGLADLIQDLLRDKGEPTAYITGQEAGGAFVMGVRYGKGILHHQIEGDRPIYWTGPSLGFDFGADANKVFVLVYNLNDSQEIYKRYPAAEGNAYVVGGMTAGYLRRGDVVLIPIRMGAGLRLGVNAGYMRFSEKNRWLPF